MKKAFLMLSFFLLSAISVQATIIGFANNSLWISAPANIIEGQSVKIYANIVNGELGRFEGDLEFYANDISISNTIHFNIDEEKSQLFNTTWIAKSGEYKFSAKLTNYAIYKDGKKQLNDQINNYLSGDSELLFVDVDTDSDGIGNEAETKAGTNPLKADTDGDGYDDKIDTSPLDSQLFPGLDTDKDGVSDKVDTDIDNDGLYNFEEEKLKTDPYNKDTDGDSVFDRQDFSPLDSKIWAENKVENKVENKPEDKPATLVKNDPVILNNQPIEKVLNETTLNEAVVNTNEEKIKKEISSSQLEENEKKEKENNKNLIMPILKGLLLFSFLGLMISLILLFKAKRSDR
ncbi:MAG: thrombospondin type 3 repeat-containing protein [Patescibacteria group bacterium]